MTSYRDAGVDVERAGRHVQSIAQAVTDTWAGRVTGEFGGFAAGVEVPEGFENPVLMMSTDGVGTKLELARRSGVWSGVGQDLVAMCVDDLAAVGARAIGFVDYLAVGSLRPNRDRQIVASIAAACALAGCPLLGGETAVHPGVMESDAVDLAGTAMGVVEKGERLGPHRVKVGDVLIGLKSPNLRSNGFSLVRAVMGDTIDDHMDDLLEPSIIYAPAVIEAVNTGAVSSAAHITGGGIVANLARVFPDGLGASIDTTAWQPPPVFDLISSFGVARDEMFRTFNMGLGFCLAVDPGGVDAVTSAVLGHEPLIVGHVRKADSIALV